MVASASLVLVALAAAPASVTAPTAIADAPAFGGYVPAHVRFVPVQQPAGVERVTVRDAPVTPAASFGVSALTGLTGLVNLFSIVVGPPRELPGGNFALHARIATSLFLMSVGASMGDLLNDDLRGFFIGAGGRVALAALGYGTVMLMEGSFTRQPGLVILGALFTIALGFGWMGWAAVDLIRSAFAPQRWVERENRRRQLDAPRRPPSAVPGEPGMFRM